ncbi:GUN4 domain-containing protein [Leptothoe sp. EHU-05/26/07-4]
MRFLLERFTLVCLIYASISFAGVAISGKALAEPTGTENVDMPGTSDEPIPDSSDINDNSVQLEEDPASSQNNQDNVGEDTLSDTSSEVTSSPADITPLRQFLDSGEWEAADQETFRILLSVVGEDSRSQGRFNLDEWENFISDQEHCSIVRKIDGLWNSSSDGTLGFSAQRRMFQESDQSFLDFYRRIKWLTENADAWLVSWKYTDDEATYIQKPDFENAPSIEGHLPALMEWEIAPGDEQAQDRRFEMINFCNI